MRVVLTGLLVLGLTASVRADHWPAFRGGARGGVAEADTLPDTWSKDKNVRWKAEVPGGGWSSPIVWGDRVFVTTTVSSDTLPESRKGLYIKDLQGKPPTGDHARLLLCFDARTGKERWRRTAFDGPATGPIHIKNSLASETPVTDGAFVYAYFGNVGVACYDLDGKEVWKQKTPVHKMKMGWGTAASPALADGKLFLVHDNEEKSFLVALDGKTGKELWRRPRDEKSNWVTPFVWQHKERTELVTNGSNAVRSYSLDGKPLWELKGGSMIAIPTPFTRHGLLYVASGYVLDPVRRPVHAIRPGASGDITPKGEKGNPHVAWTQRYLGAYHPTPLVYGDYLYVLYDQGSLACHDAKTGQEVYGKKRLGRGATALCASPWAYGGKVFCLSEEGETIVLKAGKDFEVVGRNSLGEMCLATPALAGGSLFVRTQTKLYCLRKQ